MYDFVIHKFSAVRRKPEHFILTQSNKCPVFGRLLNCQLDV